MQCDIVSSDNENFRKIGHFLRIFPKPLNGLKAYAFFIREILPEHVEYRNACFYDFILHCNAFALKEIQMNSSNVESARDYFILAVQLFSEIKDVCFTGIPSLNLAYNRLPEEDLTKEGTEEMEINTIGNICSSDDSGSPHRVGTLLIPNSVEAGSLTLLYLTFSNWACVELTGKNSKLAFTLLELLEYVSPSVDEFPLLGYRMDIVSHINTSMCEIMRCNFPEALNAFSSIVFFLQEKSKEIQSEVHSRTFDPVNRIESELPNGSSIDAGRIPPSAHSSSRISNSCSKQANGDTIVTKDSNPATVEHTCSDARRRLNELRDVYVLSGIASIGMAISEEYLNTENAGTHYQESLVCFEFAGIADNEEDSRSYFYNVVQNTKQRLSDILAIAAEPVAKVVDVATRKELKKKGKEVGRKKNTVKGQKLFEVAEHQHFIPPPINGSLRTYIREEGLPVVPGVLLSLDDAVAALCAFSSCDFFISPLSKCIDIQDYFVAAVFLPTETPLAWASDIAAFTASPPRQSVWSPRVELPGYLKQCLAFRDEKVKEKHFKPTVPIVRSLMPKPLPQVAIDSAAQDLNAALKLLSNRLVTLIKNEKAFEDRWVATERIKQALKSYYVPQVLIAWKAKRIEEENLKTIQENHAARILQRFFRLVVKVKPRLFGFKSAAERREKEQHDAATILQKYVRRFMAQKERKYLEMLRDIRVGHIKVIQSLWRRNKAKRLAEEMKGKKVTEHSLSLENMHRAYAATLIQSHYRRHLTQLLLWEHQGCELNVIKHHLRFSRYYYATLIQKHVRGMLARRKHGPMTEPRRQYGKNKYWSEVYNQATVTIQKVFRGWRTREITKNAMYFCRQHLANCKNAERAAVEEEERNAYLLQNIAAAKIQSLVRMSQAKKEVDIRKEKWRLGLLARQQVKPPSISLRECEY